MHRTYSLVLVTGLIALGSTSCGTFAEECYSGEECPGVFGSGGASSTASTSSTGSNPACMGTESDLLSPSTIANFVNDDCGVFVRADAADLAGDGTRAKPFKSVQAAIDGAKGKAIFVCAGDPFQETLTASAPLHLYGGFDCTKDWSWDIAARSALAAKADEIPITIAKAANDATIWNMAITAAGAAKDGGSSIAVAIDDVAVSLTRCDVTAGSGKDGLSGMSYTDAAAAGAGAEKNVGAACTQAAAALPGKTMCNGAPTDGGSGGRGGISGTDLGHGQNGDNGAPAGAGAQGGFGAGQPQSPSNCLDGASGESGSSGKSGLAGQTKNSSLTLTGVIGGDGGDGKAGGDGRGGGGGGGEKAGKFCGATMMNDGPGPGGGGGGAGGCGGLGGGGGRAGGSSIAILSLGTQVKLVDVTLTSSHGGKGGSGGISQIGGQRGKGAAGGAKSTSGASNGCSGGDGGEGGDGGNGGGGAGGHSIGLALAGTPNAKLTLPYTGGVPGNGADGGDSGIGGPTAACWDFVTHTTCAK